MSRISKMVKKLQEDTEYQEFFKSAMKKFGVKSLGDFANEKDKKDFFNYIDKNYKGESEN